MDIQTIERLSAQRDGIYDWVCDRFQELLANDDHDSALALADEFFEWLDPEQMDEEETLYTDYNEIRELDQ
jgi:hypothetical protein